MLSSVNGVVFHDLNSNGFADSGERPISNMPVALWNLGVDQVFATDDDIFASTSRTNNSGEYTFSLNGNTQYAVQFGTQFGAYRFSPTNVNAATLSSSSISSDGVSSSIVGGPLGTDVRIDAGLDTIVPTQTLYHRLQQSHGFQRTHVTYLQNVY